MLFRLEISKAVGVVGVWQVRQTPAGFRNVSMPLRTASSELPCRQTLLPRPHSRKPPAAGTSLLDAGASCKGTPLRPPRLRVSQDLQTARLAVPLGSLTGLDQEQEAERARREAEAEDVAAWRNVHRRALSSPRRNRAPTDIFPRGGCHADERPHYGTVLEGRWIIF